MKTYLLLAIVGFLAGCSVPREQKLLNSALVQSQNILEARISKLEQAAKK